MKKPADPFLWLALPLLTFVCFCAYLPGLYGPPLLDDFTHLSQFGPQFQWGEVLAPPLSVTSFGEQARPLSMLTFAMNAYLFNKSFFMVKLVNVFIHILNTVCVVFLAKSILPKLTALKKELIPWVALLSGALWALHPMSVNTVLYAIQRMTLLASFFSLLAMMWYVAIRPRFHSMTAGKRIVALCVLHALGLCAVLCKQSGILVYGYLFAIELCVFQNTPKRASLTWLQWLAIGLPAFTILAYFVYHLPDYLVFYLGRDFTLADRLMAESHILFRYLAAMFWPNLGSLGFFQDDMLLHYQFNLSHAFLGAFWICTSVAPLFLFKKFPLGSFCILWFVVSHLLESTVLPLELAFLHRNYLALFAVTFFAVGFAFTALARFLSVPVLKCSFISILLTFWVLTNSLAFAWSNRLLMYAFFVSANPDSYRANAAFEQIQLENHKDKAALQRLDHMIALRPSEPAAYLEKIRVKHYLLNEPVTASDWSLLINSASTMGDFIEVNVFAPRLLKNIVNDDDKQLNYEKLHVFFKELEKNKAISGFPPQYPSKALNRLHSYMAILDCKLNATKQPHSQ